MTPLQFEAAHEAAWGELEKLLTAAEKYRWRQSATPDGPGGARLALLYRRACQQLALAQARAYPIYLTQRLEQLVARAHRLIYRPAAWNWRRFTDFLLIGFPQAVRAHRRYLLAATLLFTLPLLLMGWACWRDPGFILHLLDPAQVRQFDAMYGDGNHALGRERSADTDWEMFGFYIKNNISVGFQCFASGLLAGLGTIFYLVFNGVAIGAVSGYLITTGKAQNFLSFVVTHGAFELTAIVLSGAAGLCLGHALLAPGRRTRLEALKHHALGVVPVIGGAVVMLVIAAGLEAFWSSARWVMPEVKYGVGATCWALVLIYLGWQGRPASAQPEREAGHAD
ncbi:MAG: stage II sporulation protein M [Azonexus sp.]|jgi:uncharacterized membrane protein SpoIIM required for sporulation|nr:stage II sporulation protein M [Azonexus sp.]